MGYLLPVCCFPSVRWWHGAHKGHRIVSENYVKQTYRNRFDIADSHGLRCLTVPVQGQKGVKIRMDHVALAPGNWRKQHLSAIQSAYGKAPYFEHYFPLIEEVYSSPHTTLMAFNEHSWELGKEIGLTVPQKNTLAATSTERPILLDAEPGSRQLHFPAYTQVFADRQTFLSDLSIIDLAMNLGPRSAVYVQRLG